MHIFMDEAGTFSRSLLKKESPSIVGAMAIPGFCIQQVFNSYAELRETLPKSKGEVKGRGLSEEHVAAVIKMLARFPVIFEATVIEMGRQSPENIESFRMRQMSAFTESITKIHHPNAIEFVKSIRDRMEKLPMQLFVQSIVAFDVIANIIDISTLYYVQRWPAELGAFHWVIDAKEQADPLTPWEVWWQDFMMPALQSMSASKPMHKIEGEDYSHFDRFEIPWQPWAFPGHEAPEDKLAIDLRKLMTESFRFSGEPEPGLELVDILTTTLRRALVGHLQPQAWMLLRHLMVHRNQHYVRFVSIDPETDGRRLSYSPVVMSFKSGGRNMLVD